VVALVPKLIFTSLHQTQVADDRYIPPSSYSTIDTMQQLLFSNRSAMNLYLLAVLITLVTTTNARRPELYRVASDDSGSSLRGSSERHRNHLEDDNDREAQRILSTTVKLNIKLKTEARSVPKAAAKVQPQPVTIGKDLRNTVHEVNKNAMENFFTAEELTYMLGMSMSMPMSMPTVSESICAKTILL
jgi:hypothetical protein